MPPYPLCLLSRRKGNWTHAGSTPAGGAIFYGGLMKKSLLDTVGMTEEAKKRFLQEIYDAENTEPRPLTEDEMDKLGLKPFNPKQPL